MRNEKLKLITYQYNLLFLIFLFVNNIVIASHIKNLLKQAPFYGKAIKSNLLMLNYYLSYHFLKNV